MTMIKKHRRGELRRRIINYLNKNPGSTTAQMAKAFNVPLTNMSAAMIDMHKAGLTNRDRKGMSYVYMLRREGPAPIIKTYLTGKSAELQEQLDKANALLAETQARLEKAETKYPDLRPVNYEAYRHALDKFYVGGEMFKCQERLWNSPVLQEAQRRHIDGLIAAMPLMPLMPQGDAA